MLATREEHADVWIGLREPVDAATYRGWIESQDVDAAARVAAPACRCGPAT